jgi:transcriptional regulator GlxA family with amidase domain
MTADASPVRHVGIFCFDGMEELDAVGPWEVLAWWTQTFPQDGYAATTFSATGEAVTCSKGLTITPHHSRATVPALDVLVYPGGRGTIALSQDAAHLDWLREQRASVGLLTSVCTGSTVFAAAGLLRNRPATTYHLAFDRLQRHDPTISHRPGERFVDDGDIITSAGISAGIDMALHIVGRLSTPTRAREVRDGIEYAPEPPH